MICRDVIATLESGRCALLTGRKEHLDYFEAKLAGCANHIFVLKGGMGKKQRRTIAAALAAVREAESRVILATGSYIGEGFDDPRLIPWFWRCQFPGRARSSSTLADYIASTTARRLCRFTITWTVGCVCWQGCTSAD